MLDGTGKQLLELLQRLDAENVTYDALVYHARETVANAEAALQGLLALEGLCDATTLKTPTGRKRRCDRGTKRVRRQGNGFVAVDDVEKGDAVAFDTTSVPAEA